MGRKRNRAVHVVCGAEKLRHLRTKSWRKRGFCLITAGDGLTV